MVKHITEDEIKSLFPPRPEECNKGDFGYVALIGGSIEYSGAIRLAAMANAAMRSGAGVASIAAPRSICPIIANSVLEATLIPMSEDKGELIFKEDEFAAICRRYDCITFGMGIGNSEETKKAVEYLLENYTKPLVIDADGLNAMSKLDKSIIKSTKANLVLTPHVKEFSRLSGFSVEDIKTNPQHSAEYLADELGAVILLKGSTTIVTEPASENGERKTYLIDRGCPGMATAGSGDVLSGILSALAPNTDYLTLATAAGAYINGAAGELAQNKRSDVSMTASDTASCIAEIIESIIDR